MQKKATVVVSPIQGISQHSRDAPPPTDTPHDLTNIMTYTECIGIFVLMLTGTWLYSVDKRASPFVTLGSGLVILAITLYQHYVFLKQKKKRKRNGMIEDDPLYYSGSATISTLASSYVWLGWLIYGLVFREFSLVLPPWIGYFQVMIVISLVLASYARESFLDRNHVFVNILFFVVLSLLFIPHSDTISHDMEIPTLFLKVTVFYVLYVLTQLHQSTTGSSVGSSSIYSNRNYSRYKSVCDAELKIVRSSWVLLAPKYLVIGAMVQFVPLLWKIWKRTKNKKYLPTHHHHRHRDILPVTKTPRTPPPSSRKQPTAVRRELDRIIVHGGEEIIERKLDEAIGGTTKPTSSISKHQTNDRTKESPTPPPTTNSPPSISNSNSSSSHDAKLLNAVLQLGRQRKQLQQENILHNHHHKEQLRTANNKTTTAAAKPHGQ